MTENQLLDFCTSKIEQKLNWASRSEWKNSDYLKLQAFIFDSSGINISALTLKRIFGKVNYDAKSSPQLSTKNGLAIFIGYKDWADFKTQHNNTSTSEPEEILIPGKKKHKRWFIVLAMFLVLIPGLLFFFHSSKPKTSQKDILKISTLIGTSPLTVSIHYDISKLDIDSAFLIINDDEEYRLSKDKHVYIKSFVETGKNKISLRLDGKTIENYYIYTTDSSWYAYFIPYRKFDIEDGRRIKHQQIDGVIHVDPESVKLITKNMDFYRITYRVIQDFQVDGDNCSFEIRFKNDPKTGGIPCLDSKFEFVGDKRYYIQMISQTCQEYCETCFDDTFRYGRDNLELAHLAQNLAQWGVLKGIVRNKKAQFYYNDKLIYTQTYKQTTGMLRCIMLTFKGCGLVDYVKLYDGKGMLRYDEEFGK